MYIPDVDGSQKVASNGSVGILYEGNEGGGALMR